MTLEEEDPAIKYIMREEKQTDADVAKHHLESLGLHHKDRNGNSIIHVCADVPSALVHVCAAAGVNINAQNFNGDTALHLAIRKGRRDVVNALLMCGSDLSIKNKLGQSACEEAKGDMLNLINRYQPGLPQAIIKGEFGALQRLVKLWCNPHSKIKDGKSALELLTERRRGNSNIERCYNTMREHLSTLELVNAVLAEDVEKVKDIVCGASQYNVNARFRDRRGWTPVACAISQHQFDIVKLLIDEGHANLNLRIRHSEDAEDADVTVPIYFKTLELECPAEIWGYVHDHMDPSQDLERDNEGNTAIFRAIENGKPSTFIEALIRARQGASITERNKDGLTPRDVAVELGDNSIVKVIDSFILDNINGQFLMLLPVSFYGAENLNIRDQNGKSLGEIASSQRIEQDIQATQNYNAVEKYGVRLFEAASSGDIKTVAHLNKAPYHDQNGYTALTRAIVFNQLKVAEVLVVERPALKLLPDNCNRYPLHYAYALPEEVGRPFIDLLLSRETEHRVDKDGREAAEYKELRSSEEVSKMLSDARTLDPYRKLTTATST